MKWRANVWNLRVERCQHDTISLPAHYLINLSMVLNSFPLNLIISSLILNCWFILVNIVVYLKSDSHGREFSFTKYQQFVLSDRVTIVSLLHEYFLRKYFLILMYLTCPGKPCSLSGGGGSVWCRSLRHCLVPPGIITHHHNIIHSFACKASKCPFLCFCKTLLFYCKEKHCTKNC